MFSRRPPEHRRRRPRTVHDLPRAPQGAFWGALDAPGNHELRDSCATVGKKRAARCHLAWSRPGIRHKIDILSDSVGGIPGHEMMLAEDSLTSQHTKSLNQHVVQSWSSDCMVLSWNRPRPSPSAVRKTNKCLQMQSLRTCPPLLAL